MAIFNDAGFLLSGGIIITAALLLPEKTIKRFRSIRFNVFLFLIIALISALGTFIPQDKPSALLVQRWGPFLTYCFEKAGFFHLYHTVWFGALLGLMAFDVIVCKLRHLPIKIFSIGFPKNNSTDHLLNHLSRRFIFRESMSSAHSVALVQMKVTQWFKRNGISFKFSPTDNGMVFYGGRQRLQRWGDFILHISIVVILLGGLWGAIKGFEESVIVTEGSSVQLKNRPYEIFLHKFNIEYYQSTGAPSLYSSDIEIREQGQLRAKKVIKVNDPLELNKVRFYQASWGITDQLHSATIQIAGQNVLLKPNELTTIPGLPFSLLLKKFLPTFDINDHEQPYTMDNEGRNPAILVEFIDRKKTEAGVWILQNYPNVAYADQGTRIVKTIAPPFRLIDVDPVLFSGIQVGYDPGVNLFWSGALLLLVGLCLHFYTHQRRLALIIRPSKEGTLLTVGGWNSRRPEDFRGEFNRLITSLKLDII